MEIVGIRWRLPMDEVGVLVQFGLWWVISDIVSCGKVSLSFVCAWDVCGWSTVTVAAVPQSQQLHVTISISRAHTKPKSQTERMQWIWLCSEHTFSHCIRCVPSTFIVLSLKIHSHINIELFEKHIFCILFEMCTAFFPILLLYIPRSPVPLFTLFLSHSWCVCAGIFFSTSSSGDMLYIHSVSVHLNI